MPQNPIPTFDEFVKEQGASAPKVWTLDRAEDVKKFFRDTFKRELPTSAFGESDTHRRMRLDHSESLDVPLHPNSAEGQALIDYLKREGFPFLAYDRAVKGAATGPHIHIGLPSKGLGSTAPANIPTFDEFVAQQPEPPPFEGPESYTGDDPDQMVREKLQAEYGIEPAVTTAIPRTGSVPEPQTRKGATSPVDIYTQEGRQQRDIIEGAVQKGQAPFAVSVALPKDAKGWETLTSEKVAGQALRQAAAARRIPAKYVEEWIKSHPDVLRIVNFETGQDATPADLIGTPAYDEAKRSLTISVQPLAAMEKDYHASQGTLSKAADYLTDDKTSPGEKMLGVATPVVSAGLRTLDIATRPLQAADAGFWASMRGAKTPETVAVALAKFFGNDPERGRNIIAEALRHSDRLRAINPRLPSLLAEGANMFLQPSNLIPLEGAVALAKGVKGGGRVAKAVEAVREAATLERGMVEARPLGIGELPSLREPTLRPAGDPLLSAEIRGGRVAPGEAVDTFSGRVFKDGHPTAVKIENGQRVYAPEIVQDARTPFGKPVVGDERAMQLVEVQTDPVTGRKVRVEMNPENGRLFHDGEPTPYRMVYGKRIYDPGTGTVGTQSDPLPTRFTATDTGAVFDDSRKALPPPSVPTAPVIRVETVGGKPVRTVIPPEVAKTIEPKRLKPVYKQDGTVARYEYDPTLREDAPLLAPNKRNSLTNFTLQQGGVRDAGGYYTGELSSLSRKEGGRIGLVNNKSGVSPDRLREYANEAGYGPFEFEDEFINALIDDASGVRPHYPRGAYDDIDYEALFRKQHGADAPAIDKLMDDPAAVRWLEAIGEGNANAQVARAFRTRAKEYGLSDADISRAIEEARTGRFEADAPENIQGAPQGEGVQGGEGGSLGVTDEEIDAIIAEANGSLSDADISFNPDEFGAGLDPDIKGVVRGAVEMGRTLYRAGMDVATFGKELIAKVGERVRPYVEAVYAKVRAFHENQKGAVSLGPAQRKVLENVGMEAEQPSLTQRLKSVIQKQHPGAFETSWWDRNVGSTIADSIRPLINAFAETKNARGISPRPGGDPETLVRLVEGSRGKFDQLLERGPTNAQDAHVLPGGVNWLMEPFDRASKASLERDMADAVTVLVSERTIEKAKQIDARANALLQQVRTPRRGARVVAAATKDKMNISGVGGGTVGDDVVAARALRELAADPARLARAREGAKRYREWADATLKYWVEKGRLSPEAYRKIKAENNYYAAMQRVVGDGGVQAGTGKRLGSAAQPVKKFKGSRKEIDNPYTNLLRLTHDMYREADRNEVLQVWRNMLAPQAGESPQVRAYLNTIGRRLRPHKDDIAGAVRIWVDGKPEHWKFEKGVEQALKNWGEINNPGVIKKILQFPAKITRGGVTHSPDFMVRNIIRDTVNRGVVSDVGSKPLDILKGYSGDEFARFQLAGGDNAGHYFSDRVAYHKELARRMTELSGDKNSIFALPGEGFRAWKDFAQSSEHIGRMAEFKRAYEHARTKLGYGERDANLYAASQARGLLDFSIAGTIIREVNRYIPFTNAAVQGLRRTFRGAAKNPAGFIKARGVKWATYVLTPTLLTYAWNEATGSGEEYRQLPAYQRDFFWNFKVGNNKWLRIPKPFELGVLASGVERAIDRIGNDKALEGYFGSLAKSFLPVDEGAIFGPFRALGENVANYDAFRGQEIVPDYEEDKALELRAGTQYASQVGQALQQVLRVDARKIDHLITSWGGGLARTGLTVSDKVLGGKGTTTPAQYLNMGTGLFTSSPGTSSRDVSEALDKAKELGLEQSAGVKHMRALQKMYFEAETEEARDKAAQQMRAYATVLLKQLGAREPAVRSQFDAKQKAKQGTPPR